MRVNNKRKHAHQMRANACFGTRFSTCVCAKIVRAFCVCVGRLSLTCTVHCRKDPACTLIGQKPMFYQSIKHRKSMFYCFVCVKSIS